MSSPILPSTVQRVAKDYLTSVGRSKTLVQSVAAQMIRLIMEGRYKPGQKLPAEPELARMLGVGRGSVREALTALEITGLLTVRKGKGTFVSERDDFLVRPIALGLEVEGGFPALLEARRVVEVEIAGLAAERIRQDELRAIEAALLHMKASTEPEKWDEYIEADLDFHLGLATAAHSPVLKQFMVLLRNLLRELFSNGIWTLRRGTGFNSPADHQEVYEAICRRDPAEARQAMLRVVMNSERHVSMLMRQTKASEET